MDRKLENKMNMKPELRNIWKNYNQTRISGDKKTANKLLQKYIDILKNENYSVREEFVDEICSAVLETKDNIIANNGTEVSDNEYRIQHPLFKEIILPILIVKYKMNSAQHIKWIGQLEQFFYSDSQISKKFLDEIGIEDYFSTSFFFEKSFSIDRSQKTLDLLLKRYARDLEYYVHEVPFGVLIEPDIFDEEIKLFETYYEQFDKKGIWTARLNEWKLISLHWRTYLSSRSEYVNFEDYLNRNGIKLE